MANFWSRFEEAIGWYPKGMPKEEKILVRKIDILVLSYASLAFFSKYLDVTALTNAYVSGMKEDLDLYGNRLNYINAAYECGYVVFQIPSNIVLTRVPAQYFLPAVEILFGIFTLSTAFVKSYQQLVVMRFFVGLSATSCYVGLVHIVNCWYRRREVGRRNALFWISNPLGQMFAGYLQAAAFTNLSGVNSLQGWRWLFIICSCITFPVAIWGYFVFPDVPERTTSRFLTDAEKELARSRLAEEGFKESTGLNKALFKRVLTQWRFFVFVSILVVFCQMTYTSPTPFILWLKSQSDKYSIPLVNNIGTVTNAAAVVCAVTMTWYTDLRGKRWEPVIIAGILCLFANLVLAIGSTLHIPDGLRFFAYIAVGWSYGTIPVIVSWAAEELAGDLEVRAITFATYNTLSEIAGLVVPLVAWPVSKAPGFRGGFIWATCLAILYLATVSLVPLFKKREARVKHEPDALSEEGNVTPVSSERQPGSDKDVQVHESQLGAGL